MARPEIDRITGVETTAHEWDGIKELNNPLPRWWLWVIYVSIVWSIGYWFVYPTWPLVSDYTKGMIGYSQRLVVADSLKQARQAQSVYLEKIAVSDPAAIKADSEFDRVIVLMLSSAAQSKGVTAEFDIVDIAEVVAAAL